MSIKALNFSLLFVVPLILGACGGGGGESNPERFRVVNAAHRSDYVEVSIEKGSDIFNVNYGETSDYHEVSEGKVNVKITSEDDIIPAIDEDITFKSDTDSTYLLTTSENKLTATLLTDDNSPPDEDSFKLRCINAAISDEGIDCYLTFPDGKKSDVTPFATDVKITTASNYQNVVAASYELHVTRNGGSKDVAELSSVEFGSGGIYTVVLMQDESGGSPYKLELARDQ